MSKVTLVVEFENDKIPPFHAKQNILGGQLSFVAFSDLNESTKDDIRKIILKNLGRLPSVNDDIYDRCYRDAATYILEEIANKFDLLDETETDDED